MKGEINIWRSNDPGDPNVMSIEVIDDSSGTHFLTFTLTAENLMLALTGRGGIECEFTLRGLERVGLIREHKEEIIILPEDYTKANLEEEVKLQWEVDGWIARMEDVHNHHRQKNVGNNNIAHTVTFYRYLKPS